MMKNALIVGGSSGIGAAVAQNLSERGYKEIIIMDKQPPLGDVSFDYTFLQVDLAEANYDIFDQFIEKVDTLIITAGFGRVAPFSTFLDAEIKKSISVNGISPIRIIKKFYDRILSDTDFYCAVMGSIAGLVSSPLFAVYGAGKAALCSFIQSVNIEIEKNESNNRILNISPGSIKGTSFSGEKTDLKAIKKLADDIIDQMLARETLYIPDDEIYGAVLQNYQQNPHKFGLESYDYKMNGGRLNPSPQLKIGYLSGTFDLFHIGHLNLIRKAKQYCDYLIVGVHKDALHKKKETFISFEERLAIVQACQYVDLAVQSTREDSDMWNRYHYDYLFVGSDYKNTERFNNYERYFEDKDTTIIYFDYTQGTSSTQLRKRLSED